MLFGAGFWLKNQLIFWFFQFFFGGRTSDIPQKPSFMCLYQPVQFVQNLFRKFCEPIFCEEHILFGTNSAKENKFCFRTYSVKNTFYLNKFCSRSCSEGQNAFCADKGGLHASMSRMLIYTHIQTKAKALIIYILLRIMTHIYQSYKYQESLS